MPERKRRAHIPASAAFRMISLTNSLAAEISAPPIRDPYQRTGGAYWMPPMLHSWLMPRGMPSLEAAPTLRSKLSP